MRKNSAEIHEIADENHVEDVNFLAQHSGGFFFRRDASFLA
jgi:hypothetical protein